MPVNERLMFLDQRERTVFERLRNWWLGGGKDVAPLLFTGTATPEVAVTAPVGSIFLRSDGGTATTLYVKESGTGDTGWVAVDPSGGGGGVTVDEASSWFYD